MGATDTIDLAYWDSIKNSTNAADFKAYLDQFPKGRFAGLARNRLGTQETQVAAARSTVLGTSSVLRDLPRIGDTWTYNASNNTWTRQYPGNSPPGRYFTSMAYDDANGAIMMFGGFSSGDASLLADRWPHNGVYERDP